MNKFAALRVISCATPVVAKSVPPEIYIDSGLNLVSCS